ncbi:molybdopterin molybdotransferase MoeA [Streptomyces sp. NPDC046979]|uniref:molybdopterin molybdotransferase MoeA n=1 Tax=Streptomyces sp. NPDC046979 TaxID=3154604 RepID=UPI0033EFB4DC
MASCRDVAWARARELAHQAAVPLPARDVPLARAAGLTLADELRTRQPLPGFDTAAMDGYAIGPGPGPWHLTGTVRAGDGTWSGRALGPAEAVGISTGAPVPCGAHAVLPLEHAVQVGATVRGPVLPASKHIRRAGEDAPAGMCLVPAGTRTSPALLGLAAACGHDTLSIRPRPRVGVLVTGDELIRTGHPASGQVRDALGPLLPSLIGTLGGEVTDVHHVPDRPAGSLTATVRRTSYGTDVTVVTGSTSVGPTDQLRALLADAGARWVVDAVACRPGHPQLLAQLPGGHWIVGLPGNPYAALTAAHTLLAPLLAGLTRRPQPALPLIPLAGDIRTSPGRTRLIPVIWDGATAHPVGGHGPAFLHGAALADALASVAPDWRPGAPAPLILLTA